MSNEHNNSADALEQMRSNLEELRQIRQEIRDHNNEVTQRLQQLQSQQQQQTSNIAPNIRSDKASSYTQQRSIQSSHDPTRQNRNSSTSSTIAAASSSSSSSSSHQPIAFTIDQTHRIRDCKFMLVYLRSSTI